MDNKEIQNKEDAVVLENKDAQSIVQVVTEDEAVNLAPEEAVNEDSQNQTEAAKESDSDDEDSADVAEEDGEKDAA